MRKFSLSIIIRIIIVIAEIPSAVIIYISVAIIINAVNRIGIIDFYIGGKVGMVPLATIINNADDYVRVSFFNVPGVISIYLAHLILKRAELGIIGCVIDFGN